MVRCLLHLVCQKGRQERGGEGLFGVDQGRRRKRGEHERVGIERLGGEGGVPLGVGYHGGWRVVWLGFL